MHKLFNLISLLIVLLIAGMGEVRAQDAPPNGTQIKNKATTSYSMSGVDERLQVESNEVEVVVDSNADFALEIANSIQRFRGDKVEFDHYLINNGNVSSTFDIKIYNWDQGEYDLENLIWENGSKTRSVVSDTLFQTVTLNPGERFDFTYSGEINLQEEDSVTSILNVEALSREFGIKLLRRDSVYILTGTRVELEKTQSQSSDLQSGDNFTYTISGTNTGDVDALPTEINIDGSVQDKIILRDSIPTQVDFVQFNAFDKGTPVYSYEGFADNEFTAQLPTDPSLVTRIGLILDELKIGESFSTTFEVQIKPGASGQITNIADVVYRDPDGGDTTAAASNNVIAEVSGGATIDYYTDDKFGKKTGTSSIGKPLHIQANAASCNQFRTVAEMVTIKLTSALTNDEETVDAIETGPNTSIFRVLEPVPTRNADEFPVIFENGILETLEEDVITANLICEGLGNAGGGGGGTGGGATIETTVVVDPFGIVFDSETNEPVSGAIVSIIDVTGDNNGGFPGGLAKVYAPDGETEVPNVVTTSADGEFGFPYLPVGTYRIEVETPDGYSFSSEVPLNLLPQTRNIDSLASFGGEFEFANVAMGTDFDIPLDPLATGVLFTRKTVDRPVAEIGDYINYTIEIRSEALNPVNNLSIDDLLPFGFEYQLGSAKLDDVQLADPEGGKGPALKFNIGNIDPQTTRKLTYRVFVGPGSDKGKGINVAIAQSDEVIVKTSNEAKVKVEVRGGLFNDDAFIIGKVFQDCNENDIQDPGEIGVPGVRLYLENGNYVITDAQGMYTFYAVSPNKHVLKVDNYTLPEGSKLSVLDNRHANDPSSRFVDVKKGQMHRADFAICECDPVVNEEIEARRAQYSNTNDLASSVKERLNTTQRTAQANRGQFNKASGVVGGSNNAGINAPQTPGSKASENNNIQQADTVSHQITFEQALAFVEPELSILNLQHNDTLLTDKHTIWAAGRAGAKFLLSLNGELIDESKVGQTLASPVNGVQGWEYVSIEFKAGENILTLEEVDPFGNVRGKEEITVYVPGEADKVIVTTPRNDIPADGQSTALIKVEVVDKDGIKVGSRFPVTLDNELGTWLVEDTNPNEPGVQTFLEEGSGLFELKSTAKPASSLVRASVGVITGEVKVEFLPDLRPLIAAGIIEGTLRFTEKINISSDKETDGFERELRQLSVDFSRFTGDARIAFFLKGKVSGRTLLTAGFDSEKDKEERLFRDIRPDEFYPVYGESSVKGFEAQSSSRLYVRLDRGKTYALYGDFITQERDQDIRIGGYDRAQTGLKTKFEQGNVKAEAFGVNAFSSRKIREFQGQGISRYDLPDNDIVDNSEIVEIVTYDREQPEVILSIEKLTRFRDYVIDPFSGVITFKNPVSSIDEDFNPIFIRTTYEVTNDQDRYLVGGVKVDADITEGIKVGASAVKDNNPDDELTLVSGNVVAELSKKTKVVAEVANTTTDSKGSGSAARLQVNHKGSKLDISAQVGKSDENFNNQGASLGAGRTEAKTRTRLKLNSSTNISNEVLFSRNDTTSDYTFGSLLSAQKSFANNFNAEIGVRYSENYRSALDSTTYNTNFRTKLKADLPFLSGASAFGEYEQDLDESEKKLIAVGADYRMRQLAKFYARHEFISSAAGVNTINRNNERSNSVFGIDANYMRGGKVYSEYRLDNALDGRSGQAAVGLRNQFLIREGFGLNVGFERVFTVEGPSTNDGTAITSSVDYTAKQNWKATARAEARFTSNSNTFVNSIGYGLKLNQDWTFLTKNIISVNTLDGVSGANKLQERLQIGAAYRDVETNRFDALFRYEFRHEIDKTVDTDFFRTAHVFSSHGNYHPTADWTFSGRVAAKYSLESDSQLRTSSFLELISGRALYDINEKWDAGINASILANSDFTTKDYGLGVEAGFLVATNLRLAAGYNFFGFEDEDLTANNYTQQGAYLGFSYKFDERLFDNLIPARAKKTSIIDPQLYLTCEVECEEPMPEPVEILPFNFTTPEFLLTPAPIDARSIAYGDLEILTVLPKDIHFNNNSTYINQPAAQMLDKVAKFLRDRGDTYYINVTGHTDKKSSQAYNLDLSMRRAKAVRAYLVAAGVSSDRLQFEGLSFSLNAVQERDRVDMAKNRRVELTLSDVNENVRFISQVEDLQVNPTIPGIKEWDYIYLSEHDVVPAYMTLSGTQFNRVHEFIVRRLALTLKELVDLEVRVTVPSYEVGGMVMSVFSQEEGDLSRLRTVVDESANRVEFAYSNQSIVKIIEQDDDVVLANNEKALDMMDNMLNILRQREDQLLLRDFSQSYSVPEAIKFSGRTVKLSNEVQAIASRVGSYLFSNRSVSIQLSSNGTNLGNRRVQEIKKYLVEWGIESYRIEIDTENRTAQEAEVRLKYLNADSIHLLELELIHDGKGGGK